MLDVDKLKEQIKEGIQNIVIPAIERVELLKLPQQSAAGNEMSKNVADTFDELVSDALADIIANAIDYYVKNMNITGTIITNGSPTTQVAQISPAPTPITGGKIPNTLGIN
jgi:hypothetical protein